MLRSPNFWFSKRLSSRLLANITSPFSLFWSVLARLRALLGKNETFEVPIICVGNINVGGSGKTPTTIALAEMFSANGTKAQIISRGYKGKSKNPKKVGRLDSAIEMGDEPILMANFAPVWVANSRRSAIVSSINDGADLLILDDGFQDSSISKTVSIVTVDAKIAFGNGKVLPSGPLRESLSAGLRRADILLVIGEERHRSSFLKNTILPRNLNIFSGELKPVKTGIKLRNARFIAVAGIAHPDKFFDTLEKYGAILVKKIYLPDHSNFSDSLIQRLKKVATYNEAQIIITEKDAVRIPENERINFVSLPVRLNIFKQKKFIKLLQSRINHSFK